jgi:hypothetical protein
LPIPAKALTVLTRAAHATESRRQPRCRPHEAIVTPKDSRWQTHTRLEQGKIVSRIGSVHDSRRRLEHEAGRQRGRVHWNGRGARWPDAHLTIGDDLAVLADSKATAGAIEVVFRRSRPSRDPAAIHCGIGQGCE